MNYKKYVLNNSIPFNATADKYKQLKIEIEKFQNSYVIYRKAIYKGKGRPKKSDYIKIKRKDLREYIAFEIFESGLKTSYTNLYK